MGCTGLFHRLPGHGLRRLRGPQGQDALGKTDRLARGRGRKVPEGVRPGRLLEV